MTFKIIAEEDFITGNLKGGLMVRFWINGKNQVLPAGYRDSWPDILRLPRINSYSLAQSRDVGFEEFVGRKVFIPLKHPLRAGKERNQKRLILYIMAKMGLEFFKIENAQI